MYTFVSHYCSYCMLVLARNDKVKMFNQSMNKLRNDDDFSQAILMKLENELTMSNLIYNPHESNSFDFSYCAEFDPDANIFCQQNIFSGCACSYHTEDGLNDTMSSFMSQDAQYFSISHMNIRIIRANLKNFDSYLQLLNIEFSVIGITEIWLHDAYCVPCRTTILLKIIVKSLE